MHKDVHLALNSCTAPLILIISIVTAHLATVTLRHFVTVQDFTRLLLHVRMEAKSFSEKLVSIFESTRFVCQNTGILTLLLH